LLGEDIADELPSHDRPLHFDGLLWDGPRQIVIAYQQGETLGEPCRLLDAAKDDLPVSIRWQLPPTWAERFPMIHFANSSGRWAVYKGWQSVEHFVAAYNEFNPPPKSDRQVSPFKEFVRTYADDYWTWPGRITDHLLDPEGPHRFSAYELRGLKVSEKKRLHAAHHQELIAPGRRPPAAVEAITLSSVSGY